MTDEPAADCPSCGTVSRRLFFPAGIVFKGSGFYKTDSRSASGSPDGAAPKKSASAEAKPDASKSDTKSAPSSTSTGAD
jgi:predicted nucleic acid-binding Zn ribbon protein